MNQSNPVPSIIQIENLVKTFPQTASLRAMFRRERKIALRGINLNIRRGEIFGLLGPNGAGKTTLIKILSTLVRPTSGLVRVDGFDVLKDGARVRGRIGLVNCDDRSHYWRLSARENLRFYAALSKVPPRQINVRIDQLLELTGLGHAAGTRLSEFSSGMKQRLAVARGLLSEPDILFMDEPSRSLDPIGAHDLRRFIRENIVNQGGRTVILATNLMNEAEFLCDRVALINHGQLYAQGTVSELGYALKPSAHYRLAVKGLSGPQLDGLGRTEGVVRLAHQPGPDGGARLDLFVRRGSPGLPRAIQTIVELGGEIWACDEVEVTLEEVFRAVLGQIQTEAPASPAPELVERLAL